MNMIRKRMQRKFCFDFASNENGQLIKCQLVNAPCAVLRRATATSPESVPINNYSQLDRLPPVTCLHLCSSSKQMLRHRNLPNRHTFAGVFFAATVECRDVIVVQLHGDRGS
ncbi:hypothetical protein ABFS82_12G006100 [Erythranthe guttata]